MQGDELQNPSFTYCVEKIDNFDKVCLEIAQTDHFIVNYFCILWSAILRIFHLYLMRVM